MRAILTLTLAALGTFCLPAPADAKDFVDAKAGLSVTIPDDWATEVDEDGNLGAEAPGDIQIGMVFQTVKGAHNLKEALDAAEKQLDEDFDEFDIAEKTTEGKVNGLATLVIEGTGTDHEEDGTKSKFVWAGIIVANGNHFLICMVYGTDADLKKHDATMKSIVQSIKKTDKKAGFAEAE